MQSGVVRGRNDEVFFQLELRYRNGGGEFGRAQTEPLGRKEGGDVSERERCRRDCLLDLAHRFFFFEKELKLEKGNCGWSKGGN